VVEYAVTEVAHCHTDLAPEGALPSPAGVRIDTVAVAAVAVAAVAVAAVAAVVAVVLTQQSDYYILDFADA